MCGGVFFASWDRYSMQNCRNVYTGTEFEVDRMFSLSPKPNSGAPKRHNMNHLFTS